MDMAAPRKESQTDLWPKPGAATEGRSKRSSVDHVTLVDILLCIAERRPGRAREFGGDEIGMRSGGTTTREIDHLRAECGKAAMRHGDATVVESVEVVVHRGERPIPSLPDERGVADANAEENAVPRFLRQALPPRRDLCRRVHPH